jgi:molecular chaperone GrpE (heat shock protein)
MGKAAPTADEFAAAMQQLSAEAAKSLPSKTTHETFHPGLSKQPPVAGVSSAELDRRLASLEQVLCKKLEDLSANLSQNRPPDLSGRFRRIEEQLAEIRKSETVNQRLFDSLHDELLKYRDNFVHESLQKPFIHDLVHLFDDLSSLASQLRTAAEEKKRGHVAQWRENLDNSIHALMEILHRFEVKEIESKDMVDRTLHRVVSYEPADFQEDDGRIVARVKRGFLWRGKLIRPEEVIAKRYG